MLNIYIAPISHMSGKETVYGLLEKAYLRLFGETMPQIQKTQNGKPYFPKKADVHFSLSHAKTHVMCAISDNPVGVDIESPRTISERAVSYFASPEELALFEPIDLWVLKESYIKLVGGTLSLVKKTRFSYANNEIITRDPMSKSKLYRHDECRAAVSTFGNAFPDSPVIMQL